MSRTGLLLFAVGMSQARMCSDVVGGVKVSGCESQETAGELFVFWKLFHSFYLQMQICSDSSPNVANRFVLTSPVCHLFKSFASDA